MQTLKQRIARLKRSARELSKAAAQTGGSQINVASRVNKALIVNDGQDGSVQGASSRRVTRIVQNGRRTSGQTVTEIHK